MLESLLIIKLQVTQSREYNHSPTIRNGKTFLSVSYDYGTTQVFFPLTIAKFLRIYTYIEEHLRTAAFESKIEFVQSMKTVQSAANIYW